MTLLDRLHILHRELYSAHTGVGFGVIASSKLTDVTVGGWVELDRTTLGATNANIDVTSLADKRYYMILADLKYTASLTPWLRLNSVSTGTPYADRFSDNGATDSTNVSQNQILLNSATTTPTFSVGYASNLSSAEKLINALFTAEQNTAGAGTAPDRRELYAKHAQTSNPIDAFNLAASTSTFASGSEMVILEWDPADTHTTNFWEELSTTTLGSAAGSISSGTITAKKYLWYQMFHIPITSFNDSLITFNSDTASNYAFRSSALGGSDSTTVNASNITLGTSFTWGNVFNNGFIINNSANEKLQIHHHIGATTAGASNAPRRAELVGKWANTAAQITDITFTSQGANYDIGTTLKVWGSD